MHVSLNECKEATVRAAASVGLPPGLAEEAGMIAGQILRSRIAGDPVLGNIGDLVEGLEALDRKTAFRFAPAPASSGLFVAQKLVAQKADALLSSLWCGPSIGDRLIVAAAAGPCEETFIAGVEAVDIPSLILHPLLRASKGIEGIVKISCRPRSSLAPAPPEKGPATEATTEESIELICRRGRIEGAPVALSGPASMSIRLTSLGSERTDEPMLEGGSDLRLDPPGERPDEGKGAEIEEALWRRLYALAEGLLVENSERSRLSGAGAGVIDND